MRKKVSKSLIKSQFYYAANFCFKLSCFLSTGPVSHHITGERKSGSDKERAYLKTDYESSNRIVSKRISSGPLDNGAAHFDSEMDKLNGMHKTTNGERGNEKANNNNNKKKNLFSINENGLGNAKKPDNHKVKWKTRNHNR